MSDSRKPANAGRSSQRRRNAGETRRDFLNEIAVGALGIAGLGSVVVTYQYLSPNVLV